MAEFHFVEDYVRFVDGLMAKYPLDEAMSLAVGGSYDRIGGIEFEILRHFGLHAGYRILDLGCGSGRLAFSIAKNVEIEYIGLDVVQSLLDYAEKKCPPNYKFILNRALTLPVDDTTLDMACAFSVFTHLLHSETFLYLQGMHRALRAGGTVVCSFLEFQMETHWAVFESTLSEYRKGAAAHLNQFIERNQISTWAQHIGFSDVFFLDGTIAPWPSGEILGQSIAVLKK